MTKGTSITKNKKSKNVVKTMSKNGASSWDKDPMNPLNTIRKKIVHKGKHY